MNIEKKIYLVLKKLGARPEFKGYFYLKEALQIVMEEDEMLHCCNDIYPAVAEVFNTKPTCVERSIRYCIADIRNHTSVEILNEVLGENTNITTNSNFIGRVYEYLKYEGDELEVTKQ